MALEWLAVCLHYFKHHSKAPLSFKFKINNLNINIQLRYIQTKSSTQKKKSIKSIKTLPVLNKRCKWCILAFSGLRKCKKCCFGIMNNLFSLYIIRDVTLIIDSSLQKSSASKVSRSPSNECDEYIMRVYWNFYL